MADAGSKDPISFCKMTPMNSENLLFGNMNSTMGLYDYQSQLLKEYKGHKNTNYMLDSTFVKNNGKWLILSGSEDGQLYGWDLNSQKLVIKLPIIPEYHGTG